jgi:hypothetical protein
MTNCQYKKSCALYSHNSLQCGIFSQRCKYHKEFDWYDKQVVKEHTDRIRMEQVNKLEQVFDSSYNIEKDI